MVRDSTVSPSDAQIKAEVLIVGAGPTGLTAALDLTRRGHAVRIIEKNAQRSVFSKALGVTAATLQRLEASGATARLLEKGRKVGDATIMRGNRKLGGPDFSQLPEPWNFMLILPQSETEEILEARLAGLGVQVERGIELINFHQSEKGISATTRHVDGGESKISASYLLAADGARSRIRKALKLEFPGHTMPGDWSLADIRATLPVDAAGPTIIVGDQRLMFILRIDGDLFRIASNLPDAVDHLPSGSDVHEVVWESDFSVHHRQVDRYRVGRVFLAGDAAHIHSPLGGRGMNLGIGDAVEFARLLDEGRLDDYQSLRHGKGARIVRMVSTMTWLMASPDFGPRVFRRLLLPLLLRLHPVTRAMARQLVDA